MKRCIVIMSTGFIFLAACGGVDEPGAQNVREPVSVEGESSQAADIDIRSLVGFEIVAVDGREKIELSPGEKVELQAIGVYSNGNKKPLGAGWAADIGRLESTKGEKVTYILPENVDEETVEVNCGTDVDGTTIGGSVEIRVKK